MEKKEFNPDTGMCNLMNDGFGCTERKHATWCKECLKEEIADCKKALKNLKRYLKENKK